MRSVSERTSADADVARVAGMIGEPARAAMLSALLGGQALPAGELARRAGVAPATASSHLRQLVESGLVTGRQSGRHRYYALAGAEVAAALEALARIAPARLNGDASLHGEAANGSLRFARTCYDHLAGRLGVRLTDAMLEREIIAGRAGYEVTVQGSEWLRTLGIDIEELRRGRRVLARPCLDWTERRDHLAGAVGAALATAFLERTWLVRVEKTRAVRLTLRGREGLRRALGLEVGDHGR